MTKTKHPVPTVKVKPLTLTKSDIKAFERAVEHRVGRTAYADWRIISGIYWKALEIAKAETGETYRQNP
jgi:hypothetical protein